MTLTPFMSNWLSFTFSFYLIFIIFINLIKLWISLLFFWQKMILALSFLLLVINILKRYQRMIIQKDYIFNLMICIWNTCFSVFNKPLVYLFEIYLLLISLLLFIFIILNQGSLWLLLKVFTSRRKYYMLTQLFLNLIHFILKKIFFRRFIVIIKHFFFDFKFIGFFFKQIEIILSLIWIKHYLNTITIIGIRSL